MAKKRNYKKEYRDFHGTEEQKKNRAARNKARREAMRDGTVSKGDDKEVGHLKPLSKGGSNAKSNRRVMSRSTNRKAATKDMSRKGKKK